MTTTTATTNGRTPETIRSEIEVERAQLANAVEQLREGLGEAADVGAKLRNRLPFAAASAFAGAFVLSGGIGATMRFFARRSRER